MKQSFAMGGERTGMRNQALIFTSAVFVVLVAALIIWRLAQPAQSTLPLKVSISFAGYTNDAAGRRLATFALTNQSNVGLLRFRNCSIEGRLENSFPSNHYVREHLLAPSESELVTVVSPTNLQTWRVTFYFSPDRHSRKLRVFPKLYRVLPEEYRTFRSQCYARSEWIDQ